MVTSPFFRRVIITFFVTLSLFIGLKVLIPLHKITYESAWMDSPTTHDMALDHPEWLVSNRWKSPTEAQLQAPVVIVVHGYSSSTFEWWEFRDYADSRGIATSLVLLGGHGRNLDAFRASTAEDWGAPIITEYERLRALGYRDINIAASSTGATLVLHHLAQGSFKAAEQHLRHIYFVDPFVIPGNKMLRMVDIIGPILGSLPPHPDRSQLYRAHWYNNDPYEALSQLNALTITVREELNHGIQLPKNVQLTVFKATGDSVAPFENGKLITSRVTDSAGRPAIEVVVSTNYHVFTQLAARNKPVSQYDRDLQRRTFDRIITEIKN